MGVALVAGVGSAFADTAVPLDLRGLPATAAAFERRDPVLRERDCADIAAFGHDWAAGGDATDGWAFTLPEAAGGRTVDLLLTFDVPGEGPRELATSGVGRVVVVTPAGWRLLGGSATVAAFGGGPATFSLSHTCAHVFASGTGGGHGGGDVPGSGMAVGFVLLIGAGLLAPAVALVGLRGRHEATRP